MGTTPKGLTTLASAQAGAEVFFNENMVLLENGMSGLEVKDRDLTTPPGSPSEGDVYILAGTSGDWGTTTNKAPAIGDIAIYYNAAWIYFTPSTGQIAYIDDEKLWLGYSQGEWHFIFDDWSTTETWTGRYDGSEKLYRKRVNCGAGPNATVKNTAHGALLTNDGPTWSRGVGYLSTGIIPLSYPLPIAQLGGLGPVVVEYTIDNTNIKVNTNTNFSLFTVIVDMEYTK